VWDDVVAMPRQRRKLRREGRQIRRRRSPEVARQELLDAAERVFAAHHPDRVGLKEVAREAGVSHALITHYFGTYGGLIEAALERRVRSLRERIFEGLRVAGALTRPEELIDILFAALEDPVHLRLMTWLVAGERPAAAHAFALQERGLALVARQVAEAIDPQAPPVLKRKVELALLTAVSAAFGYAVSKHALAGALGRAVTPALDRDVRVTLAGMIQSYLRPDAAPTTVRGPG
jgi:TetR/AcrR family transcriptional regulator, repressor for neighboring sulfatase